MRFVVPLLLSNFFILLPVSLLAEEFAVVDVKTFHSVLPKLQPGDTIQLAAKEWRDSELHFSASGTEKKPITLKAAVPGKTVFTGTSCLRISGEHLVVEGLYFKDPDTRVSDLILFRSDSKDPAHHCRLTQCAIINTRPAKGAHSCRWVGLYGTHHRIDHCAFIGKTGKGVAVAVFLDKAAACPPSHLIDHNYFGKREKLGENGGETIRIGDSKTSMLTANCLVEHNFFEHCNGEIECVSNKSCGNTYRHNTFFEVSGTLTLRHGNGCLVENNTFIGNNAPGTGGIRIIGENHIVRGNHLENLSGDEARAGICFMMGIPNSPLHGYFQVKHALVENNVLINCKQSIYIGASYHPDASLAPVGVQITGNQIHSPKPLIVAQCDLDGIHWRDNRWSGPTLGIPAMTGIQQVAEINDANSRSSLSRQEVGPDWLNTP